MATVRTSFVNEDRIKMIGSTSDGGIAFFYLPVDLLYLLFVFLYSGFYTVFVSD